MDRLTEIRQKTEAGGPVRRIDMKYLLSEVDRLNKVLPGYAESARVIALYLSKFCDRSLPYSEMIADAARKADAEITTLTARAEAAEAERDAAVEDLRQNGFCGSCSGCNAPHDPNNITWCYSWEWRGPQEAGEGEQ